MENNAKVKFGIVGCGVIGLLHAQQLKLIGAAELVAFADIDAKQADRLAKEFGGKAYYSLEEMLADPNVEVVCICTPSGLHGDQTILAARYGKHIIVEKPMDVSLNKADQMIAACREHNVKLCSVFQHRFDPATVQVKQNLDAGRFGTLALINAHVHWYRSPEYYASGNWRGTWGLDGGGALMNQAIHTLDLMQHFGGPVRSLSALTANRTHPTIEVEDSVAAIIEFVSGAIGTFTATTSAYPGLSTGVEVIGEHGSSIIQNNKLMYEHFKTAPDVGTHGLDYATSNLVEQDDSKSTGVQHRVYGNAHYFQFLDMIDAVRSHREPLVNGEEGRKVLELVLAIYESSRIGKIEFVPRQAEVI